MNPRISFHRILPTALDYIPQSLTDFLDKAAKQSPTSDLTVADAIQYSRIGAGDIYAIMDGDTPTGAVFYMYGECNSGKLLDVALLGGNNFRAWKDDAHEFTKRLAKMKECSEVWLMGPQAWGRMFPDMEAIGVVYRLKVN